jgi:hypothetical protein
MAFEFNGKTYTDLEVSYVDWENEEIEYILYVDLDDPEDDGDEIALSFEDIQEDPTTPETMVEAFNTYSEGAALDSYADHYTHRAESGWAQ